MGYPKKGFFQKESERVEQKSPIEVF